ncbi:hypothetical protein JB92DRAFT_3278032 [Gautieria morchelliformis]|nr:hypothetical protein JB92DRAFT_3278032 [Gautieria morchelliformis]
MGYRTEKSTTEGRRGIQAPWVYSNHNQQWIITKISSVILTTSDEWEDMTLWQEDAHTTKFMAPAKPTVRAFYEDYRDGEKPHAWLQSFEMETNMVGYDEARRTELFAGLMTLDEEAGDLWESLGNTINKTDWTEIVRAFGKRWPRPKKTGNERDIKKFQLTELELRAEEIGTMVKHRGRKVPAHHTYTEEALTLGTVIGDVSGLLIDDVRKCLPDAVHRLIVNKTYGNWEEFHDILLGIRMTALMEAKPGTYHGEQEFKQQHKRASTAAHKTMD